jgi:hypothetical protein
MAKLRRAAPRCRSEQDAEGIPGEVGGLPTEGDVEEGGREEYRREEGGASVGHRL